MRENGHQKQATSYEVLSFEALEGGRSKKFQSFGGRKERKVPKLVLLPPLGLGGKYTHTHTRFDCSTRSALGDATPHTLAFLVHGFEVSI